MQQSLNDSFSFVVKGENFKEDYPDTSHKKKHKKKTKSKVPARYLLARSQAVFLSLHASCCFLFFHFVSFLSTKRFILVVLSRRTGNREKLPFLQKLHNDM